MMRAVDLRTNALTEPVGIDSPAPELAWRLDGDGAQEAYRLQVCRNGEFSAESLVWDSGDVVTPEPFGVRYAGAPLTSRHQYRWRVRLTAQDSSAGEWSEPAGFETAILDPAEWRAAWIGTSEARDGDDAPVYLRRALDLPCGVVRGRAYVSALGWYRLLVNGEDLTGPALVPRWTPFDAYVEYQVYDVSKAFRSGDNDVVVVVADGRFRGFNGGFSARAIYGDRLAAWVQVHLDLEDGSSVVLTSDGSWQAAPGRIVAADPMRGERVDLRRPAVPEEGWAPAVVLPESRILVAEEVPRLGEVERLPAVAVTRTPSGKQVVDLGQNFAGVVRIRLSGASGSIVRLTYSEVLHPGGELDTAYIQVGKKWEPRDEVTLADEECWYQPWFTIRGFRYLEVDGLADDLLPHDVDGVVLSSDLPVAGDFDCSDPRLVQLHRNVVWSLRSNFLDTPTDCPTRERSGWTGDIQAFAPTATTLVDVQAYLRRYLRNLAAEQLPGGEIPPFVPSETSRFSGGPSRVRGVLAQSSGWGDASVLVPWALHRYYGDRTVLAELYPVMTRWVDAGARRARTKRSLQRRVRGKGRDVEQNLLDTGFHWGEWLRPGEGPLSSLADSLLRSRPIIATAYLEHSSRLLSQVAGLLGRADDERRYLAQADAVRAAWRSAFVHADGRLGRDRQDDYVRALAFDLVEPHERAAAVDRLVQLVERAGDHLQTGFLSTPMLLFVLADGGRADVALRLLLQTSSPSWLHAVERGATTVWETWEGYDRTGEAKESHNHYAFGAVAGFLTERVAGLSPAEPGYRVLDVRPTIGGGLTFAGASVQTPYGRAATRWDLTDGRVLLQVSVPAGTTARVRTPTEVLTVGPGRHELIWHHEEVG